MHRLTIAFQVALIVLVSGVGLNQWVNFLLKDGDILPGWATLIGSALGAVAAVGASVWASQHQVKSQAKAAEQTLRVAAQLVVYDLEQVTKELSLHVEQLRISNDNKSGSLDRAIFKRKLGNVETTSCEKYTDAIANINPQLISELKNALRSYKKMCDPEVSLKMSLMKGELAYAVALLSKIRKLSYKLQGFIETGSTSMRDLKRYAEQKAERQVMAAKEAQGGNRVTVTR
jgi:hypothetical protein